MTIKNLLILLSILSYSISYGQIGKPLKSHVSTKYLYPHLNNPIRIVAQQNEPVALSQLKATFHPHNGKTDASETIEIKEGKGYFIINPRGIGEIELTIEIGDTIDRKWLGVIPMEAVVRLGRFTANEDEKIGIGEIKGQEGLIANVECCDISATCTILGYWMFRMNAKNQIERTVNKGGRFQEKARELIQKAESGDLYIFKQIKYKCPFAEQPYRLDDLIIEVK